MRKLQLLAPLFFAIFLLVISIPSGYASANITLTEVDDALGEALGTTAFVGGLILSIAVSMMILGTYGAISKGKFNLVGTTVLSILSMGFCIAVGWLDYFFIIVILLLIAVAFGVKSGNIFGERGG